MSKIRLENDVPMGESQAFYKNPSPNFDDLRSLILKSKSKLRVFEVPLGMYPLQIVVIWTFGNPLGVDLAMKNKHIARVMKEGYLTVDSIDFGYFILCIFCNAQY